MRSIYLDEAGISRHSHEPVVTVAGVILHTDKQWRALREHFTSLIEEFIPEEHRDGFVFHTHEIWHGAGIFDPKRYTKDRRELLRALSETLTKFQLPVAWGAAKRSQIERIAGEELNIRNRDKLVTEVAFMTAFSTAAYRADIWMKEYAKDECANLIVENNNELRRYARATFKSMKDGTILESFPQTADSESDLAGWAEHLTLVRLIDVPSFMEKRDSPPLQLADFCAYMLKRYWGRGKSDVDEYMPNIMAGMMYGPFGVSVQKALARLDASSSIGK
jgi:hypothetical protein